ncbi:hypothetical protein Asp14428_21200 [Actinoplanes sp. NBRC 14428]|nr:hypothetical protein Asp14428_21200 [Actinoplanes sp. NBRC 14428]
MQGGITDAAAAWSGLRELRAQLGRPVSGPTGADHGTAADAGPNVTTWPLRADLDDALGRARAMRDNGEPGLEEAMQDLIRTVQIQHATLTALTVREQVSAWVDQVIAFPDLTARVTGYVGELDTVLRGFSDAFAARTHPDDPARMAAAATAQVAAITALAELLGRRQVKDDLDELGTVIGVETAVKMALLATAVVAAAALTAGMAGAAVGGALASGAAAGGLTLAEAAAVGAIGSFAVEALWFTVAVRAGNELLLGPDSVSHTSFAEELFWNAAMMGGIKAVERGFATVFVQLVRADTAAARIAFVAGRTAVAQLSLFAFAELQSLVHRGRLLTGEEAAAAALQQIVMTATLSIGRLLGTSFAERLTGEPRIDATRLQLLEARRALAATRFRQIGAGRATPEQVATYLTDAQALWTDFLKLVDTLPPEDARVPALIEPFAKARFELELRLAMIGILSPDSGGLPPACRPVRPGVVAVSAEARARLEQFHAEREGTLEPATLPGVLVGARPGGARTIFLTSALPERAPTPAELALVRGVVPEDVLFDDVATLGLVRLTEAFGARKVDNVLAAAGDRQIELLRLLAHPELAQVTAVRNAGGEAWEAIGQDARAVAFGRAYGPRLAVKLYTMFGPGPARVDARERTAGLIEAAEPARRDPLIQELLTLDDRRFRLRIGTAKRIVRQAATKDSLKIDRSLVQWRTIRAEIERNYPHLTAEQRDGRADLDQVLEAARAGKFAKSLSHATRLAMLDRFDALGRQYGLSPGSISGRRGTLAEWLFIPGRGFRRTVWLRGKQIRQVVSGCTVSDDWYQVDGRWEALELKSDLIHQQSTAELRALAGGYLTDAAGDAENLPPGSRYALWFIREPGTQADMDAMITVLRGGGSPITRVRFGDREWVDLR